MATFTDPDGDVQIRSPTIQLRVGRGKYRPSELKAQRTATVERAEANFTPTIRGKVVDLIFQNFRAGEVWSPMMVVLEVGNQGPVRLGVKDS